MKKIAISALSACALSACATYDIDLMPRAAGDMAHGTAKQIDKSVSIEIKGETFNGRYAYIQGGSFTLANAFSGTQSATGMAASVAAVGNGNVLAHSDSGHNLRCVFTFSGWSQSGTGTCLTDDGGLYDLQITR